MTFTLQARPSTITPLAVTTTERVAQSQPTAAEIPAPGTPARPAGPPPDPEITGKNPEDFRLIGRRQSKAENWEVAEQSWFTAGELFEDANNFASAIECYRESIIAQMQIGDAHKDWHNPLVELRLRQIAEKEPDIARRTYRRLEVAAYANSYRERSNQFHISSCDRICFSRGNYTKWALYWIWHLTCGYGSSLRRWLISILASLVMLAVPIALFRTAVFSPTPSLQCAHPLVRVPLQAFALLAGGNGSIVEPIGLLGHLLTTFARILALILLAGATTLAIARLRGKE